MTDDDLPTLAASEDRVLVTFSVADFPRIVRRWAEEGRSAIIVGVDHSEFSTIIRVIQGALDAKPDQREWADYTCFVTRRQ